MEMKEGNKDEKRGRRGDKRQKTKNKRVKHGYGTRNKIKKTKGGMDKINYKDGKEGHGFNNFLKIIYIYTYIFIDLKNI